MFKLDINTANAAFEDECRACEVARILRGLAARLESGEHDWDGTLADINGNTVGRWSLDHIEGPDDDPQHGEEDFPLILAALREIVALADSCPPGQELAGPAADRMAKMAREALPADEEVCWNCGNVRNAVGGGKGPNWQCACCDAWNNPTADEGED